MPSLGILMPDDKQDDDNSERRRSRLQRLDDAIRNYIHIVVDGGLLDVRFSISSNTRDRGILVRDDDSENRRRRKARLQLLVEATRKNKDPDEGDVPIIRFSNVIIREYPSIIGDNPECATGPSLAIDWNPQSEVALSLDEYEKYRPQRRTTNQLILSEWRRWEHFLSMGYAREEIVEALKPVNVVRRQRRRTRATLSLGPVQELQECLVKKVWNLLCGGSLKRKERKQLQSFTTASNHVQQVQLLEDSPRGRKANGNPTNTYRDNAADATLSTGSYSEEDLLPDNEDLIDRKDTAVKRDGERFETNSYMESLAPESVIV